ncbi:MAG: hypothetical protein Greene101449_124 [Candidatus Peregrinibacteria bacterium Greene1014_49]|nr:MAG: hypothetical protein Greene101449_124 [Candidatus Peregrinibacteria bacterium Greene1014_49]
MNSSGEDTGKTTDQPIFGALPPDAEDLAQEQFTVITFPGQHGHPESRELAEGAEYMGAGFREMLRRAGVPYEKETVPCPKRAGKVTEAISDWCRDRFAQWRWRAKDETEQLRRFEQFKLEVDRAFDVMLKHLLAGRKVLHAAASHDAIGRVLACKTAFPASIILDFDKHPDFQVPGSGDNPGNSDAVNGHAVWVAACTGVENAVFAKLLPKDAKLLERRDVLMTGILHPDKSEAYGVAGVDPVTKKQVETPIPHVMGNALEKPSDEEPLKAKIREWIDERKSRYGVEKIQMGIEDDPDSVTIDDIGPGITMPTKRGMTAELKYNILEWLHEQPDVEIVYYGTAEVRPDRDEGQRVRKQIELWASAAFDLGDIQYYHKGYGGGTERDERVLLGKRTPRGTLRHALTATAASILTLIGAEALRHEGHVEKPAIVAKDPVQPTREELVREFKGRIYDQHTGKFLDTFSRYSDFKEETARFRESVEQEDPEEQNRILESLVERYQIAEENAPSERARMHLGELALSEFYRGWGNKGKDNDQDGLAGQQYLRFQKALHEKRNS